jgi:hypothetical protein
VLDFTHAAVAYCLAVAVLYLGLWVYYDRVRPRRLSRPGRRHAFFCPRFQRPYEGAPGAETAHCPLCAKPQGRLRF